MWNEKAERGVLGSILVDPYALHEVMDILEPRHFFSTTNRIIFKAMRGLNRAGVEIDPITVVEAVQRDETPKPRDGGWESYIVNLLASVPTSVNASSYARIVTDHGRRRELLRAAENIATMAHNMDMKVIEAMGAATQSILDLQQNNDAGQVLTPRQYVDRFLDSLQGDDLEVVPTPWIGYNNLLDGGYAKPHAHILAARPKMGKSALAVQEVAYASLSLGMSVHYATTEMSENQFTRRVVSQQTGIPLKRLKRRELREDEWAIAMEMAGKISEAGPVIDVTSRITPSQIKARAMRTKGQRGLDLLVVDHIHEMASDTPGAKRHLELGAMARELRDTAKDLGVPILIVAQLSRSVESRKNKKPLLSDLRESGALEETGYTVSFLYRDHYYNDTADPAEATLILAAHREGETGEVPLKWNGSVMRFEDPVHKSNGKTAETVELPKIML